MKTYQHELKAEYFEQDIIMQKELKRIKNEWMETFADVEEIFGNQYQSYSDSVKKNLLGLT